jgi:hypothetical protein
MSLVAWWPFNGSMEDNIGDYDGTGSPSYVDGKMGDAYDANSEQINFGNPDGIRNAFKGTELTIAFWWRQNSNQSAWQDQVNKGSHRIEHGGDDYGGDGHGPGYLSRLYDENDDYKSVNNDTISDVSQGEWFHFVLRKDADEVTAWVNGVKDDTATGSFSMAGYEENDFIIGQDNVDDYMCDFRLYDHAISKKKIVELSRAKVLHYKLDSPRSVSDASGLGNRGDVNGAEHVDDTVVGSGAYDFSNGGGVVAQNDPSLQIVDDLTISFWAKPFDIASARQNPIHKNYTDEYTMTMETNGDLSFYVGDGTGDYTNYRAHDMFKSDNEWVHVTAVKDTDNGEVVWYRNGSEHEVIGLGDTGRVGTDDVIIGDGYTNPFNGLITDFRIYAEPLSASGVEQIHRQRASIDENGNLYGHQHFETKYEPLIADYTVWDVGTTGTQGSFGQNGSSSENEIVEYEDPFGNTVPVWKCIPDSESGADGGWNMNFTGDNGDRLRMSVFVKRTGTSMNGSFYHGCDNNGNTLRLDGTEDGNPYFMSGNLPSVDTWYLLVGVVHPHTYTGPDTGTSGIYDLSGEKLEDGIEFKWGSGDTQELRDYLYYSTDTDERQYFVYPRVDVVDGTEPSIDQLVNGLDAKIRDQIQSIDTDEPQPLAITPERNLISNIRETGPATDALIAWWKLDGNTVDYSGNGNHAVNRGASITGGIGQDAYDFDTSNKDHMVSEENLPGGDPPITLSVWAKSNSTTQSSWTGILSMETNNSTNTTFTITSGGGGGNIELHTWSNSTASVEIDTDWHHYVGVNSGDGKQDFYVDGEHIGSMYQDLSIPSGPAVVGSRATSVDSLDNRFWGGKIQDARVHNVPLTEEQVKVLYNLTDPRVDQRVIQRDYEVVHPKSNISEML